MWYSWSGAKNSGSEFDASVPDDISGKKPTSRFLHCFPTILDPGNITDVEDTREAYLSTKDLISLWKQYLKNVHPLVMIFFDWEIELIIQRAAKDLTTLTHGEQAMVSAIVFIATMSLSEDQCLDLLREKKFLALARFQRVVESSLLVADFVVTSDRFVLQAFMLYLASRRQVLTVE
jgi:hypothetical protein